MRRVCPLAVLAAFALACEDGSRRRIDIDPGTDDAGSVADAGSRPDAGPPGDAAADARPAADAHPADAAPPDADPPDPHPCQVTATSGDRSATCGIPPDAPDACERLARCVCGTRPPDERAACLPALLEPRGLVNLSDYCHQARWSIGDVVRREDWQQHMDVRVAASPACDLVKAR